MSLRKIIAQAVWFFAGLATPLAFALPQAPTVQTTLTLDDAYRAALAQSEVLASQTEAVTQAEERYRQALSGVLPRLDLNAGYTAQDRTGSTSFFPASQPQVRLTATQPIFRGLREFAALKQTSRLEETERWAQKQAALSLYRDVATSFLLVASLEQDVRNFENQEKLTELRVKEVQDRIRIGRSRASEVLNLQSQLASVRATAESTRGQLGVARETLAFLTGQPSTAVLADSGFLPKTIEGVGNLSLYLDSVVSRPDLHAARSRFEASDSAVGVARGAHLPSIDVSGNYYFIRRGVNRNVDWDAAVTLSMPIFQGGLIASQVREAASIRKQAELDLARLERQAEQEVRSSYATVQAGFRQLEELKRARELAEKLYREQSREYRLGLVSNVDVLISLTSYQDTVRALDRGRYALRRDWTELEIVSGKRTP